MRFGEAEKAAGAAGNPIFAVTFEEKIVICGSFKLRGEQNVEIIGYFCESQRSLG